MTLWLWFWCPLEHGKRRASDHIYIYVYFASVEAISYIIYRYHPLFSVRVVLRHVYLLWLELLVPRSRSKVDTQVRMFIIMPNQ